MTLFKKTFPQVSKHVCLSVPFIEEATPKGSRKEHCMCIKEKQNISSQSFLRNLTSAIFHKYHIGKICSYHVVREYLGKG